MQYGKFVRWGWSLALLWLLSGCSVKLAYNNLDRLVRWQVGEYVTLEAEQKAYLRRELDAILEWHRRTQLPLYAAYLQGLSKRIGDGLTQAQIDAIFSRFQDWGEVVQDRSMPMVVHLMASLSDAQVAQLPEGFAQSNAEIAEPEVDGDLREQQARWADEYMDLLTRFTGRLTRTQREYVQRRALGYQPERKLWVAYRERWQGELMRILEQRKEADFGSRVAAHLRAREEFYGPEYKVVSDANIALSGEIAEHLLANLTEQQVRRFVERLQDLGEDLQELAQQT
ncbi:MAG: DUF6279 family lipoprotein [Pseudomonadota bacterium]